MNYNIDQLKKISISLFKNEDGKYTIENLYLTYDGLDLVKVNYSQNKEMADTILREFFKQNGLDPRTENVIKVASERGLIERLDTKIHEKEISDLEAEYMKSKQEKKEENVNSVSTLPKPRERGIHETDEEYVNYLREFYKSDEFTKAALAINPDYKYVDYVPKNKTEEPTKEDKKAKFHVIRPSENKEEQKNETEQVYRPAAHAAKMDEPVSDLTQEEEQAINDEIKAGTEDSEVKPKNVRFGRVKAWMKRIGLVAAAVVGGGIGSVVLENVNRLFGRSNNNNNNGTLVPPVVEEMHVGENNVGQNNAGQAAVDYNQMGVQEFYNQLVGTQKQAFYKVYSFLVNASDKTDQMSFEEFASKIQNGGQMNFRLLEDEGNTLNFTVDEVMAAVVMLNNYGPEELAQLYHGTTLNSETIISNFENFYTKVSTYYMNATQPLGISQYLIDSSDAKAVEFWNRLETSLINCNNEVRTTGGLSTNTSDQFIRDAYYSYLYENAYANDNDIDPAVSFLASAMIQGYVQANANYPENMYLNNELDSDRALAGGIKSGTLLQHIREEVEKDGRAGIENLGISNEQTILDAVNDNGYCNRVNERLRENVMHAAYVNDEVAKATLITALAESGRNDLIRAINENGVTEELLDSIALDPILASSVETYREGAVQPGTLSYETLKGYIDENANVNHEMSDIAELVNNRRRGRVYYYGGGVRYYTVTSSRTIKELVDYDSLSPEEKAEADRQRAEIEEQLARENAEAEAKKEMNDYEHTAGPEIVEQMGENGTVHTEEREDGSKGVVATDSVTGQDFDISEDAADVLFQAQVNGDKQAEQAAKDALQQQYQQNGMTEEQAKERVDELADATQQHVQEERDARQEAADAIREKEEQSRREAEERAQAEAEAQRQAQAEQDALIQQSEALANGQSQGSQTPEDDQTRENFGEEEQVVSPAASETANSAGDTGITYGSDESTASNDTGITYGDDDTDYGSVTYGEEEQVVSTDASSNSAPAEVEHIQSADPQIVQEAIAAVASEMASSEPAVVEPEVVEETGKSL